MESVRAFKEDINFLPNEAKFRIYIISSAENMTFQAQNSLLKMLEEPPPYVKFILTSRDKNSLLQTVLSRVLSLKLPPMQSDALVDKLKKEFPQKTSEEIMSIARLSGGYYKKATAIAKDDFLFQDKDAFLTLLNYKGQKNREGFFKLGEKLLADRKKDLDCLIDNFLILLRDVAVVKKARESYNETYFCADSLKIEEISSKITDRKIQSLTNLAYEAKGMISMNGNFTLLSWFFLSGIWEEIN